MSRFVKCGMCVATLALWLGPTALAQTEAGRTRSGAVIAAALRLMDAACPDVKAGTVQITGKSLTSGLITFFGIQLAGGDELAPPGSSESSLCYGVFEFQREMFLAYRGTGGCVRRTENQSFRKWVEGQNDHPTALQILQSFRERGAQYGPDREQAIADRLVPIDVLEQVTGATLELSRLRFMRLDQNERNELLGYSLHWEARYAVQGTPDVQVDLYFEPFSGGLVAMRRRPPE